jgi:hypothetical protein
MEVIGWIAIAAVVAVVLVGVMFGLMSIPDARRYLKIRRM